VFGQIVLLVLIQIGGIVFMIVTKLPPTGNGRWCSIQKTSHKGYVNFRIL
jgi:hypothetical protein